MTTNAPRKPRADAARNVEKVAIAAREVYMEQGANAPLDEIARRAGVGVSTLFRHFPDKRAVVRAALHQGFTEKLGPALTLALADEDPYRGLVTALESAMTLAVEERRLLAAATDLGARTFESTDEILHTLTELVRRAQAAGTVREDLTPEDVPRLLVMLMAVLGTMDPASDGWRRYLALLRDSIAPADARPLPPAVPLLRPDS